MKLEEIPGIEPDEVELIRKIARMFNAQSIQVFDKEMWNEKTS